MKFLFIVSIILFTYADVRGQSKYKLKIVLDKPNVLKRIKTYIITAKNDTDAFSLAYGQYLSFTVRQPVSQKDTDYRFGYTFSIENSFGINLTKRLSLATIDRLRKVGLTNFSYRSNLSLKAYKTNI